VVATVAFGELQLSRLMLGTVQFGLPYGIANKRGQPTYAEAREILACAHAHGVNCLDTAPLYGTAEEVLGRALAELGIAGKMVVVSKVTHMADGIADRRAIDAIVEESVIGSLKRLRLEALPFCLFHREENLAYVESLLRLRERGLVRHIGASVATPQGAASVVDSEHAEAMQVPANLLDHRFLRSGLLQRADGRGTVTFVRSVFLQGLLLLPEDEVLPELADVIPIRRKLADLAKQAGLDLPEMAIRYALSLPGATCALTGVETLEQLQQNIALFERGPLPSGLVDAIERAVPDLPDRILMPNLWSKRMPDAERQARPTSDPSGGSHS
jgi:aryl-alcohol dehydrogenase-like predicted oxidoreductase